MGSNPHRRLTAMATTIAAVVLLSACQLSSASETLLSGFDGDLSSATGTDWTSDGLTTQAFVSGPGNGVSQGTQALSITQPKSPPQLVDMKLITLDNVPLVAANDLLLMDVTVPEDVGAREVWLSFRGDDLFENSPELAFDGELPARSGTVVWDYAAAGLKDLAASYTGSFWTIAIGVRGNDFNGGLPITTVVDNIRFATIPEPTSAVLALFGFAGLAALRTRKRS
jgi:MYXO-CTERM domain-containing protein